MTSQCVNGTVKCKHVAHGTYSKTPSVSKCFFRWLRQPKSIMTTGQLYGEVWRPIHRVSRRSWKVSCGATFLQCHLRQWITFFEPILGRMQIISNFSNPKRLFRPFAMLQSLWAIMCCGSMVTWCSSHVSLTLAQQKTCVSHPQFLDLNPQIKCISYIFIYVTSITVMQYQSQVIGQSPNLSLQPEIQNLPSCPSPVASGASPGHAFFVGKKRWINPETSWTNLIFLYFLVFLFIFYKTQQSWKTTLQGPGKIQMLSWCKRA